MAQIADIIVIGIIGTRVIVLKTDTVAEIDTEDNTVEKQNI